ncbi:MAG: EAL domain-containing protein [Spirochaetales bacterium]|nr:EAL domain-containing protein [Leptospiraceae bacterium]MCP5481507.1 EAL domain-containing protein [Spirochaetales bacterium]MCP5484336.1 EAL domain-containing protein [Spirochaetales bacterium]
MAFQPIVHLETRTIYSYEALVRGPAGEGAGWVLGRVDDANRYQFDQSCRVRAIELAARLGVATHLNINFLPNAVYRPETCIRATVEASDRFSFPVERLIFEVTESEPMQEPGHVRNIFQEYRNRGILTAIDDFGAGFSGLNLLADFQPDMLKLDMALVRNVHEQKARTAIIAGVVATCRSLDILLVAEGVETKEELTRLRDLGIEYFQGYLFAKPEFEGLPEPQYVGF